ncbi:hypothetical protein [Sphingomonas bacterium]|uniref:hypothetical protein n=1 Tax=Sphingomonas bacterium TaxID=1895847 RepID=UPI0015775AE0|nr:hypothetical protein [Sphingomonas bacterium]
MRRLLLLLGLALPTPLAAASLTVTKTVSVIADGVSTANPKALPRATLDEAIQVASPLTNGIASIGGVSVVDTVSATVKLRVVDLGAAGSGPVEFADGGLLGLLASGLSYQYTSLASTSDSVDFSSDGVTWSYVPVADADGCDPNVKAIRVRLTGSQVVGSGFRLRYRIMVR